ncbi:MAG: C1 family peptidase [Bacteriovoracia bacterium]
MIWVALGLSSTLWARAQDPAQGDLRSICLKMMMADAAQLASLRPGFVLDTTYTHVVKTTPIQNQCAYGGCWVYGTLAHYEALILGSTGKKIDLSEDYIILESLRLRALDALEMPGQTVYEGGNTLAAAWIVHSVGAIPESVWKPRVNFRDPEQARRIVYFINARIAQFHVETANVTDEAVKQALLQRARTDVLDIVKTYAGDPPPEKFMYEGVEYTAKSFQQQFLPEAGKPIEYIAPPRPPLPDSLQALAKRAEGENLPRRSTIPDRGQILKRKSLDEIKSEIVSRLARGESVPASFEWVPAFMHKPSGAMTIDGFLRPEGVPIPAYRYREAFGIGDGKHAVDIVGVRTDADGKAVQFLIKNSHGERAGDEGFFHMSADYFDEFLMGIYVRP